MEGEAPPFSGVVNTSQLKNGDAITFFVFQWPPIAICNRKFKIECLQSESSHHTETYLCSERIEKPKAAPQSLRYRPVCAWFWIAQGGCLDRKSQVCVFHCCYQFIILLCSGFRRINKVASLKLLPSHQIWPRANLKVLLPTHVKVYHHSP